MVDFDPNDPDQVHVHYDLRGWSLDHRTALAEALAERGLPHAWDGEQVSAPEYAESDVDALFDELEQQIGPFPGAGAVGDESTEFGLDEWPEEDIAMLSRALVDAEIAHRWEDHTLIVANDAEQAVDELLDAIESGDVASLDDDDVAPDGVLKELLVTSDRIARDLGDAGARTRMLALISDLSADRPPYGLAVRAWTGIIERAAALQDACEHASESTEIQEAAVALRAACRPYV